MYFFLKFKTKRCTYLNKQSHLKPEETKLPPGNQAAVLPVL